MNDEKCLTDLPNIILYHRKKNGLSRVELAALAGVGKTAVFDIEHGEKNIRLDMLVKILNVLNITIEFNSPLMQFYQHSKEKKILRTAQVFFDKTFAGELIEFDKNNYLFKYDEDYTGPPISLTMPTYQRVYEFKKFPPFFDGLLPEGLQLEGLLRYSKLDRNDYFAQLITVGADLVGAVSVKEKS